MQAKTSNNILSAICCNSSSIDMTYVTNQGQEESALCIRTAHKIQRTTSRIHIKTTSARTNHAVHHVEHSSIIRSTATKKHHIN